MKIKSKTAEQLEEMRESVIDEISETTEAARDILKMRIAFWEKLVVLNAGTLTVSFTAVSSFRSLVHGDGGVGYLFASWKLFIASIILALLAQLVTINAAGNLHRFLTANVFKQKLDKLRRAFAVAGRRMDEQAAPYKRIVSAANEDHRSLETIAFLLGLTAQITTITGYIWLYKFARANLLHR